MHLKCYRETIKLSSSVYVLALSPWVSPWHGMYCGISRQDSQIANEVMYVFNFIKDTLNTLMFVRFHICNQIIFDLSDSNQCKRKRCPTTPLNSATDKPSLHTSPLPSASYSCISINTSTTPALSNLRNSAYDMYDKPHSQ